MTERNSKLYLGFALKTPVAELTDEQREIVREYNRVHYQAYIERIKADPKLYERFKARRNELRRIRRYSVGTKKG